MIKIAVVSDVVAAQLKEKLRDEPRELEQIEIVWTGSSLSELKARAPSLRPQVLIVDLALLGSEPRRQLDDLLRRSGADLSLVAYSYANRETMQKVSTERSRPLKIPLSIGTLRLNMLSLLVRDVFQRGADAGPASFPPSSVPLLGEISQTMQVPDAAHAPSDPGHPSHGPAHVSVPPMVHEPAHAPVSSPEHAPAHGPGHVQGPGHGSGHGQSPGHVQGPVHVQSPGHVQGPSPSLELPAAGAAPLLSPAQLGRLQEVRSTIQCECTNHVASIVLALSEFETYSRDCFNKNDADAAMHAHLYRETGRARRVMEEALVALCRHENISF